MPSSWRPLLQENLAARALEAVDTIAAALPEAPIEPPVPVSPEGTLAWQCSLASGRAGQALFHAYRSLASGDDGAADLALDLLDQAAEGAAAVPMSESLFSGFPGIAWTAEHLEGRIFEAEGDPQLEVDEAILSLLSHSPWPGEYDLINGLVGLGIYALERGSRPSAVRCLERIVEELALGAERGVEGAAWFSPAAVEPGARAATVQDAGLCHGATGLGHLFNRMFQATGKEPLAEAARSWYETQSMQQKEKIP